MTNKPTPPGTTAITPLPGNEPLPAYFDQVPQELAAAGVSFEPEDLPQTGPYIRPLQTQSRAVDAHDPDCVPGAEPGDILVCNGSGELAAVKEVIALPLHSQTRWIERDPGWSGPMTWHDELPTADIEIRQGDRETYVHCTKGTIFDEVKELLIAIEGVVYSLSCRSTLRTFARRWNAQQMRVLHPTTGKIMPSFSKRYQLKTLARTNKQGRWYSLEAIDAGWASKAEFENACNLYVTIKRERQALNKAATAVITQSPTA